MKKRLQGRVILILFATLVTGYYLLPSTGLVSSLPSLLPGFLPRSETMNLGLDLQGEARFLRLNDAAVVRPGASLSLVALFNP